MNEQWRVNDNQEFAGGGGAIAPVQTWEVLQQKVKAIQDKLSYVLSVEEIVQLNSFLRYSEWWNTAQLRTHLSETQTKLEVSKADNQRLQHQCAGYNDARTAYELAMSKYRELRDQHLELRDQSEEESRRQKVQHEQLNDQYEQLKDQHRQLKAEYKDSREENNQYMVSNRDLRAGNIELSSSNAAQRCELASLLERICLLNGALEQAMNLLANQNPEPDYHNTQAEAARNRGLFKVQPVAGSDKQVIVTTHSGLSIEVDDNDVAATQTESSTSSPG